MTTFLCRLADLEATGAKELVIEDAGIRHRIFVVRHEAGAAAYFNACPHARLPLNAAPDVFVDFSGSFLFCANHGAHFEVATGRCIRGPCKGESLRPLPVRIDGGNVVCTDSDYTVCEA
ncbi:MAG: Rieske (2Fe-2S) protein [Rhodospirillaceae bacterium]